MTPTSHPTTYRFKTLDSLLHQYVKDGFVDYQGLRKSGLLEKAIDELSKVSPDSLQNEDEKAAFWLNAYNLLILKLICDKYPIASVQQLGNSMSFHKFTIGGDLYSVRDIMEQKLEPRFKKHPLYAFLICGGALGQPPLISHAIDPQTMEKDADDQLRTFVNVPANARYDVVTNAFYLSAYFQQYEDNFVADFESPHLFVASYMKTSVPVNSATVLKTYNREFDWRLNNRAAVSQDDKAKNAK